MYIKMNSDKSLVITIPTTIYRGETCADLITFLVPAEYEDINMADCAMMIRYLLPDGTGKSEPLAYQPEMYKDYLQFSTVVNTRLTAQEGAVTLWLTAFDSDDGVVFKTGETIVDIEHSKDIADYMSPEDMDQLDRIDAELAVLKATKADSIIYDVEDRELQLTVNGERIGASVDIGTAFEEVATEVATEVASDVVEAADDVIHFEDPNEGSEDSDASADSDDVIHF